MGSLLVSLLDWTEKPDTRNSSGEPWNRAKWEVQMQELGPDSQSSQFIETKNKMGSLEEEEEEEWEEGRGSVGDRVMRSNFSWHEDNILGKNVLMFTQQCECT